MLSLVATIRTPSKSLFHTHVYIYDSTGELNGAKESKQVGPNERKESISPLRGWSMNLNFRHIVIVDASWVKCCSKLRHIGGVVFCWVRLTRSYINQEAVNCQRPRISQIQLTKPKASACSMCCRVFIPCSRVESIPSPPADV